MIKVEYQKNDEAKIVAFSFECNSEDDHEALDALRTAFIGNFERRGAYINSNRLVLQVKTE
ncbi:hypothetical protein D3C87_279520 [compost metagenome]